MLLLLLASLSPSFALTSRQGGPSLDLAAGLGIGGSPVRPLVGGQLSAGWWIGTYDDQYSFGKYWWLGPTVRADWRPQTLAITPMFEIRRGLELIVVGIAPFVAGGVTIAPNQKVLGYTGRGGVGLKLRRTRYWGITLRLEAGVDGIDGQVGFAGGAVIGPSFARPSHAIAEPDL